MSGNYFVINPETRVISSSNNKKIVLAKGDHNSKIFTFELPKIIEGHDITQCNKLEIHYDNVSKAGNKKNSDLHLVNDLKVSAEDNSKVIFTWGITRNATKYAGTLKFGIEFGLIEDEEEIWSWGTSIFNNIVVIDNIHNSESIEEMYADVISQILKKIESISNSLVDEATIKEAVNEWLVNNPIENNGITEEEVINTVNDYLAENGVLKTSKRYLSADEAIYTKNKHVNGTTGEQASSGAYGIYTFDISGLYDGGVRGISTFIQTYAYKDSNNEGYVFYDANGTYISGGVATTSLRTIEDVVIDVPEGATTFKISVTFDALYGLEYREFNGIALASEVDMQNKKAIADLEVSASQSYSDICLGTVYAVVGDTIQLFYKSFIDCDLDNMIVKFGCAKGKNYPRYWEFTPVASDVGEHTITIEIYDKSGNLINSASTTLVVAEASNPASAVNVLCIGDSTMSSGQIPREASRRLKGTTGTATTPSPLSLDNINFVGRLQNDTKDVGWEGTGGWSYSTYNAQGVKAVRFTVSDATNINIDDAYDVGNFCFSITEINVNDGVGNIRCIFSYRTPYSSAFDSTSASGTMTRYSGNGQNSITYTAWELENYQPFWNNDTDAFDITSYKDMYCGGAIDVICVLLQINSLIGASPFTAMTGHINSVKTFCNNIHAQLPDCKIMLSTLPLVSPNGGIAANYGSSGTSGEYNATGFNHKVRAFNKALIELGADESYKDYVTIVNSHAQFDIDNGYPITTKAVNTRVSTTETLQSNAVHPNNYGYWQIADGIFRALLNLN